MYLCHHNREFGVEWSRMQTKLRYWRGILLEFWWEENNSLPIIGIKQYQVVCLKNSARTLNLGVLACDNRLAENIFIPLQALLHGWIQCMGYVKIIISDTIAVNVYTSHKNYVVARLQRQFRQKGLDELQFIGCQNYILDLVLRHLLESLFPTESRSLG